MAEQPLQESVSWQALKDWLEGVSPRYVVGSGRKPGKSLAHRFIERQTGKRAFSVIYAEKPHGKHAASKAFFTLEGDPHAYYQEGLSFLTLARYLDPEESASDASHEGGRSWRVLAGEALEMMALLEVAASALAWEMTPYHEVSRLFSVDRAEYDRRMASCNAFWARVLDIRERIRSRK